MAKKPTKEKENTGSLMDLFKGRGGYLLHESPYFDDSHTVKVGVPVMDIAFSGDIDGGLSPGLTVFAGKSKSFKTMMALRCIKAFLDKHPGSMCYFLDSEFGTPPKYFENFKIDPKRIYMETPEHIQDLKFRVFNFLKALRPDQKCIIYIDSLTNLSSADEVKNAGENKDSHDMGRRAAAMKAMTRLLAIHLVPKGVPCVAVAHVYDSMDPRAPGIPAKKVVSGGQGIVYNANTIIFCEVAKEQDEEDKKKFHPIVRLTVHKSRTTKQDVKLYFRLGNKGIQTYSGMWKIALASGFVKEAAQGWYTTFLEPDKKVRRKELDEKFYERLCDEEGFKEWVRNNYQLKFDDEDIGTELGLNSDEDEDETANEG